MQAHQANQLFLVAFQSNHYDQHMVPSNQTQCSNHHVMFERQTAIQRICPKIVGHSYMPPLWVFGYHQCRWGYKDCNDVIDVEKKFHKANIFHAKPLTKLGIEGNYR